MLKSLLSLKQGVGEVPIPTKLPFVLLLLMYHLVLLLLLLHLDRLKEYFVFTICFALPPKALKSGFCL